MQIRAQCRSLCQPNPGKSFPILILDVLFFFICLADQRADQSSHSSNMAELSPGAVGAGRAEHQAAINSMMLERMSTDISALKKQYSRIKQKQLQQAGLLYIHTGTGLHFERFTVVDEFRKWQKGKYVVLVSMLWHFFPGPRVEAKTIEPHQASKQKKHHTGTDFYGSTMVSL